jgi:hypothetical protein
MGCPRFYTTRIAGRDFEGILSIDGPAILCDPDAVQLGFCCSIEELGPDMGMFCQDVAPGSWWIAKYRNQPRIDLAGLSALERSTLAHAFGIPIQRTGSVDEVFWHSPAFAGLVAWTRKHPRKAKQYRDCASYLGGWYDCVQMLGAA